MEDDNVDNGSTAIIINNNNSNNENVASVYHPLSTRPAAAATTGSSPALTEQQMRELSNHQPHLLRDEQQLQLSGGFDAEADDFNGMTFTFTELLMMDGMGSTYMLLLLHSILRVLNIYDL
jgi:hypothetical protein